MDFLRKIFKRYQHNQSDPQERQLVDVWYEATGKFPLPKGMGKKQVARSEEKGWQAVAVQLGFDQHELPLLSPPIVKRLPILMRYAAMLLLLGGSALGIWKWYSHAEQGHATASTGEGLWRTISTGTGQRKKLLLPDSSEVWLNNGTTIRLSEENYRNGTKREIWLQEGEAYFEVVSNKKRPFIVHVDTLQTQVLGTSFNIRAYRSLDATQIAVQSGRVQVRAPRGILGTLDKQDMLTYRNKTGSVVTTVKQTGKEMAWWNGRFVLDHAGFAELSVRLNARYGVQLKTNNHRILHTSFSAGFNEQTSLKQVLEVLCVIYKTSYTVAKADNTIIIH
jgi:ferric-dicitrate binding protein FerR (iron transport regulator)